MAGQSAERSRKSRRAALDRDGAMALAFRELARRARSEAEIAATLAAHRAAPTVARRVVARLRSLGYVDDERFAAACVERWTERGFGSLKIRAELSRHGIAETIVERLAPDHRSDGALARRVLERRFVARDLAEPRGMARAARFLAGRGFPADVIDSLFDVCD
jgi:regulatory protein